MSGSFKKINYKVRPAKCIERKMLCEVFRRITSFYPLENYRYVGFGSPFFSDFVLFHKNLNISKMVSIEGEVEDRNRFIFNRPYKCIDLEFGHSTEVLPRLGWEAPNIVWLDYDGELNRDVLADIRFLMSSLIPGSVFVISVNAHPLTKEKIPENLLPEERPAYRLSKLKDRVGEERVPIDVRGRDLSEWGTALVARRIINNEILTALSNINGGLAQNEHIKYQQLIHFNYADGAKMLTVGGMILNQNIEPKYQNCFFDRLDFISNADVPYLIEVPNLTFKEIRHLDRQLPQGGDLSLKVPAVPTCDIERYQKVYRFFPTFTESDI